VGDIVLCAGVALLCFQMTRCKERSQPESKPDNWVDYVRFRNFIALVIGRAFFAKKTKIPRSVSLLMQDDRRPQYS
jgi:hypothetical protein